MSYHYKDGDDRAIPRVAWRTASLIAIVLAILLTAGWEALWRSRGYGHSFIDGPGLWSIEYRRAQELGPGGAVLVGSSRILFDVDLPIWEESMGRETVQLAMKGTNGRFLLRFMAEDTTITGLVVVGMTPGLFYLPFFGFFPDPLEYYRNESPSQWLGQRLSMLIEGRLVFIEDTNLPLFTLIKHIRMTNRDGASDPWLDVFKLSDTRRNRQNVMWDRLLTDEEYLDHAKIVWKVGIDRNDRPGPDGEALQAIFDDVRRSVEMIRARGGEVVFVRPPSDELYQEAEARNFPRATYWDSLLTYVDVFGVHYEDYPDMQGLELPEWSHLAPREVPGFTRSLARAIVDSADGAREILSVTHTPSATTGSNATPTVE